MANPTLSRKVEKSLTLTEDAKSLFQIVYREQNIVEKEDERPRIKVSELVSKMAFYYEKIRNSVDYKEEYLLRKNAIERILRRQIVIEGTMSLKELDVRDIADNLLTELIRAGYLPNGKILETKIDEIGKIIEKYVELREYSLEHFKVHQIKEKNELGKWIISLAASDIEERLGEDKIDEAVVEYMYKILSQNIKLPANSEFERDRKIQIYIGIHRNFLKFDDEMLGFILFKYYNPNWQNLTEQEIKKIADNIFDLQAAVKNQIEHPLAVKLNRIITRYTVFFDVLIDVISENPVTVYEKFKQGGKDFVSQVKGVCTKRYEKVRSKLWRAAIRSIIYIFITKSFFAVLLEVPATKFFGEEMNPLSLAINVIFPPFLLFLIILFTKLPSDANSAKIVEGIKEIIYEENQRTEAFQIRPSVKRGGALNTVFGIIYITTFFFSFGLVVWILDKMNFTFVSIIIFLFFLALISFFSIRIRKNAKELIVIETRESIFGFVTDFFYIPIVEVGKWISEKFSRINVFVFVLDFIIEAPFKIFIAIAEEWTRYVRERKDDIT